MKTDIATTDLERRGRNVDAALPPPASTLFEVAHRGGIWEVTKDGRFYGHYHSQQPASTPSRRRRTPPWRAAVQPISCSAENDRAGKPTPLSILDDERLGLGVVVRIA
jgi:hypothetical protein